VYEIHIFPATVKFRMFDPTVSFRKLKMLKYVEQLRPYVLFSVLPKLCTGA